MQQPYNHYKESGVKWIGEIPEHWDIKPLKRYAKICNGRDHKKVWDKNGDYPIIGSGGTFGMANEFLHDKPSVLLGRKGTIDKPQYIDYPFWSVDTAYYTDIFENTDSKFFYYLCLTINFDLYKYGSTVPSMTQEVLNQIPFAAPSKGEQSAIANYLDKKTAEIDSLIAEKERLITLYEEEKKAIINHAVTKGLDPDVEMKESGIDWLGEIPAHWELRKFRFSFNLTKGLAITKANLVDSGVPCVNYGEIHSKYGFEVIPERDQLRCVNESYLETSDQSLLGRGDFVFADTSEDIEGSGNFTHLHSDTDTFAGYHTIIARLNIDLNYRYIAYLFDSEAFRHQVREQVKGVKVYSITNAILKDTSILLPLKNEQNEIVEFIENKISKIDSKIEKTKQIIALQKEYRQALISEVVTGKVKVVD